MPSNPSPSWLAGVERILTAKTHDLRELAKLGGLDPTVMYIGTRMDGADLRGQDLRGMSFTHLDRSKVRLDDATRLDEAAPPLVTEGLVLFDDLYLFEAYQRRPDRVAFGITPYGPHNAEAFWRDCRSYDGPKMVVSRARRGLLMRPNPSYERDESVLRLLGVEGRIEQFNRVARDVLEELSGPTILVPLPILFGGRQHASLPAPFCDLIGLVVTEWPLMSRSVHFRGLLTFVTSRAESVADRDSAWFQLYSRAWKLGLDERLGEKIYIESVAKTPGRLASALFPELEHLPVRRVRHWPMYDAAVLVEGPTNHRKDSRWDYARIAFSLLEINGWRVTHEVASRAADTRILGEHLSLDIDVKSAGLKKGAIAHPIAMTVADGLMASEDADAGGILWVLNAEHKVLVNLQDLRWLKAEALSLWTMIGHQARRIARGQGGESKVLYFVALMKAALEMQRVHLSDIDAFADWITSYGFERGMGFEIASFAFDEDRILFEFTLTDFFRERGATVETMVLGIDPGGPFVHTASVPFRTAKARARNDISVRKAGRRDTGVG